MDLERPLPFHRLCAAIAAGALVGALAITIDYLYGLYGSLGSGHFRGYGVSKGVYVFIYAYFFWLIGLFAFGIPVWLALIRLNKTRFLYALLSGFFIPFILTLAMSTRFFTGKASGSLSAYSNGGQTWNGGVMTPFGWQQSFVNSTQFAALGTLIAGVIWFVAYSRVKPKM